MQDQIAAFHFRRKSLRLDRKRRLRLGPRDPRSEPGDRSPAVIAWTESRRLPENCLAGIIESRRRDADHRKRDSIKSDRGAQNFRIASEQLLPESVIDHGYCIASWQSPSASVHVLTIRESTSEHRLHT